jgi:hypothetical protein
MPALLSGRGKLRQIGWFVAIWAASVVGLAILALLFRLFMASAGLTTP